MAETMSRLTLPTSTIRAMSSVSASVTRSPLRNSVSLPSRAISSPICGPPAVHDHRQHPDGAHQHHVLGEGGQRGVRATALLVRRARVRAASALPPYLTTTILPRKRRM